MSTNVTGTAHTPLGTPIPGGSDNTQTGNNSVGEQQHLGLCTVCLTGMAVNLHFESHNRNGQVKNGHKWV